MDELPRMALSATSSLEALVAFLKGESLFRDYKFNDAITQFQAATAADSTFAMAYYKVANISDWVGRSDLGNDAARKAFRHRNTLPEHFKRVVEGAIAERTGEIDRAEQIYRSVYQDYSGDIEACKGLASITYDHNPPRGRPAAEARVFLEKIQNLEPWYPGVFQRLRFIHLAQGDTTSLKESIISMGDDPDDRSIPLFWRYIIACSRG